MNMFLLLINFNVLVFLVYGLDKLHAIRGERRIPERTLWALAYCGGAPGAYLGMHLFRHKTRKGMFHVIIPALCVVQLLLVACVK